MAKKRKKTVGYIVLGVDTARVGVCVTNAPYPGLFLPFSGQGGTLFKSRRRAQKFVDETDCDGRQHFIVRLCEE